MLPVLLLAAGLGAGMAKQLKPSYTATGSYAFVYKHTNAITAKSDPRVSNPLATNNATLLGEAVQNDLLSIGNQTKLGGANSGVAPGQASNGSHYSIIVPENSSSYLVQTWGSSPTAVRKVLNDVLTQTKLRATQVQDAAGAPPLSQYSAFVTAPTQVVELPKKSPAKVLIGVLGVGVLAGAAMCLLIDRILTKRLRRGPARKRNRRNQVAAGDAAPLDTATATRDESSATDEAQEVNADNGFGDEAIPPRTPDADPQLSDGELRMGQALRS